MGLDMYAFAVSKKEVKSCGAEVEFSVEKPEMEELAYWRKHHDLHGWMEKLYRDKGGDKEFNCINMPLTEEDLDQLVLDLEAKKLPPTTGFFFGDNPPDDESLKGDLEFVEKAREELKKGRVVFYSSWW